MRIAIGSDHRGFTIKNKVVELLKRLNQEVVDAGPNTTESVDYPDIAAEVARLEKLGATPVGALHTWVVMQAPTGHRFCVVRASSKNFEATATAWP